MHVADCWFPGCVMVCQHPLLSVLRVHLPSHADQPTHPLWLHGALPHQSLQDLLLQITFLAPQAVGQSKHVFIGAFLRLYLNFGATNHIQWERLKMCLTTERDKLVFQSSLVDTQRKMSQQYAMLWRTTIRKMNQMQKRWDDVRYLLNMWAEDWI